MIAGLAARRKFTEPPILAPTAAHCYAAQSSGPKPLVVLPVGGLHRPLTAPP